MPGVFGVDPDVFGAFGGTFGGLGAPTSDVVYSVEVAFGVSPLSDPSTWTDLTAYARSFSIRRGRNHELGKTSAGVATVTLNNRDRRFDPTNTSSPYYPNVRPMQHIRIRATYLGVTTYDLFRGFVEDWGQQWGGPAAPGKGDATCEMTATDAFKLLALMEMMAYRDAVLADQPALYFPMDDPLGTIYGVNLGDGGDQSSTDVLTYLPNPNDRLVTPGSRSDGPFASTADQLATDFGNPGAAPAYLPPIEMAASPLTIEFWIKPDTLAGTPNYIVAQASGEYWRLTTSATGQLSFDYISSREHGIAYTGVASTANLTPSGQLHHIAVVRDVNTIAFYQDGMLSQTYGGLADPSALPAGQGGLQKIGYSFDGILAHLAIYPTALTADQINTHYMASCERIDTLGSGAAIDDILNCVGWPSGLRSLPTGLSTVTITPNGSALDAIQQVGEDTEHGIIEITPDGKVTFIGRDTFETPQVVSATFGDGGGSEVPYRDLVLAYDDQDLWTEVHVSGVAGEVVASDATAITNYGTRTLDISTVAATADELPGQAQGLLNRYKAPAIRPTSLTLMGTRSIAQQLSRAVGDRVTLRRRPPGPRGPSVIVWEAFATDSFNRANAALAGQTTDTGGLVWANWLGTGAQVLTNRFASPSSGALLTTGVTDHAIEATPNATGGNHQLALRYLDDNNRIGIYWNTLTLELYKVVAGASTTVATYAAGARGRTRGEVLGDAVRVYVDGTLVSSYTITDAALRTGTKAGLIAYSAGDWWDNLQIDSRQATALEVDALIEGVSHDVGPDGWMTTTFALAPPDPTLYWVLGDSVSSVLGSTTTPGW